MPYVKYCMQDTKRIRHTVFCVKKEPPGSGKGVTKGNDKQKRS